MSVNFSSSYVYVWFTDYRTMYNEWICLAIICACIHTYMLSVVIITRPPEATKTVCRGSEVIIRCGYCNVTVLPVTWIINGTSFTQDEMLNSSLYRLNDLTYPDKLSLTVFSINSNTTFQCMFHSTPSKTSTLGRVIIAGM